MYEKYEENNRITEDNERTIEKNTGIKYFALKACRAKRKKCINICIVVGCFIALFVLFMLFSGAERKINEARGYTGSRPTYEEFRLDILGYVYRESDDGYNYIENDPASEEFADWIEKNLSKRPTAYALKMQDRFLYRYTHGKSQNFDYVEETAKTVFDDIVKTRTKAANKIVGTVWLQFFAVAVVLGGVGTVITYMYTKENKSFVTAAEKNEYRLRPAVMVGREEYRRKNTHDYYIEVDAVDGDRKKYLVSEEQFNRFDSGKEVYLIAWDSGFGLYDEEDIYII